MPINPDAAFSRGDVMRRLANLERAVQALQTDRRLEAAEIGAGGIAIRGGAVRVLDDDGHVIVELGKTSDGRFGLRINDIQGKAQIRAGELASGGYGLEAINALGQLVSLLTLAFGMQSVTVSPPEATASLEFTDLLTPGPVVSDVEVGTTGQCLVFISARMSNQNDGGIMSFEVSGATSRPPNAKDALSLESITAEANGNLTRVVLVENLNPGPHTFVAKYASLAGGNSFFADRNLTVMPF